MTLADGAVPAPPTAAPPASAGAKALNGTSLALVLPIKNNSK